ncbi:NAD(P)-binding protein [Mytilinidion resinicola]|uniref:NAD(P)-binding protein n=1 Tax=Mytilinidion resinicola TaxID=574789 RepID=A0A6A6Y5K2_9PEZI|nr:NAD(P)-binding protein [Mytilinidion resinicola]KAF2803803.1 NAD(P)-binding protein [Mytilinidion resinicola]
MRNILIVGATRGLGHSLATQYAKKGFTVYATARYSVPQTPSHGIRWIANVDIAHETAGRRITAQWQEETKIDLLIICAGYFAIETLEEPHWDKEIAMYKTCAIGPVFLVHHLLHAGLLKENSRVVLVGSEGGSVTLRHESQGGGNYGGHGSKAALNMVGKLLSIDLKPQGIAVAIVHTGYLRKENKEGYFEPGSKGAVKPNEAAAGLVDWIESFDISKTGEFWAPRGASDINSAEAVLGPLDTLPVPLQLPW